MQALAMKPSGLISGLNPEAKESNQALKKECGAIIIAWQLFCQCRDTIIITEINIIAEGVR
jgi:hypothetical protein